MMGNDEVQRVKEIMSGLSLHPSYRVHEAVITSQDAARTRGDELKQGIKAILFTNGQGDWAVVDVPGDMKVDMRKMCEHLGWSRSSARLATPEEVLEQTGCEIGSVPPFGHKRKLKILVDENVYLNEHSAFNIGLRTHSAKVLTVEVKKVFMNQGALEGDFSKE